jgi:ABC-type Na+ efflux pump permease subunit
MCYNRHRKLYKHITFYFRRTRSKQYFLYSPLIFPLIFNFFSFIFLKIITDRLTDSVFVFYPFFYF